MPTIWDYTRVLEGQIGPYATLARKSGNDWFTGSLTADHDLEVTIPFPFPGKKNINEAVLFIQYAKGLINNEVTIEYIPVSFGTIFSRKLAANSGLAMIIREKLVV